MRCAISFPEQESLAPTIIQVREAPNKEPTERLIKTSQSASMIGRSLHWHSGVNAALSPPSPSPRPLAAQSTPRQLRLSSSGLAAPGRPRMSTDVGTDRYRTRQHTQLRCIAEDGVARLGGSAFGDCGCKRWRSAPRRFAGASTAEGGIGRPRRSPGREASPLRVTTRGISPGIIAGSTKREAQGRVVWVWVGWVGRTPCRERKQPHPRLLAARLDSNQSRRVEARFPSLSTWKDKAPTTPQSR